MLQQADLYRLLGDNAHARTLYLHAISRARAQLGVQQGVNLVDIWQAVGDAELALGHTAAGLAAVAKAIAMNAQSGDQLYGPRDMRDSAKLYAEARRADLAVPLLAKALATPSIGYYYSPVQLWLDPAWDPIRHDPRFQALLQKYARYKPAVTYDMPSAASASGTATR